MVGVPRNKPIGIVRRTQQNLEYVKKEFDHSTRKGEEAGVHVVTHVVNSLLGLVILPLEKELVKKGEGPSLQELCEKDWPKWDIPKGNQTQTLGDLLYHLRNAAAHGHYKFSSNCRHLHKVTITVRDSNDKGKTFYWHAKIQADKLYDFCIKLANYLTRLQP